MGDVVVQSFCSFKMVLRLKLLVELPKLQRDTLHGSYVLGRLPLACERLLAKRKSEDHGLRDLTFSKHKRSCILFDRNNLFSRHRRARIKFDSYVIKLILCLTELNVVLVSIHFKHQTGASWPGLVMIEPAMLSCFTVRTNSLQSPTVSTSSTRDFIGRSTLY